MSARFLFCSHPAEQPNTYARQVCKGSCVLFATLRLKAAAAASGAPSSDITTGGGGGGAGTGSSTSALSAGRSAPAAKRSKGGGGPSSKPSASDHASSSSSSSSKKKGKAAAARQQEPPASLEPEGLVKEGKVDVSGLRSAVLQVAEAVPEKAWWMGQWRRVSYPAWRAFVLVATGPRELMQVSLTRGCGGL